MTEQSQGQGRASEHDYRSKGPPRMPRLPMQRKQTPLTLIALLLILLIAAGALIYSRF